ncbi:MAG: ABC transporter permease, partial [Gammaproteobacteria bacterium]
MRLPEVLAYALGYLRRQRTRSLMMLLSMTIGVAAVVGLVALGEGARRYVMGEFAFLGNDVLVMFPGRKSTTGGMPPVTGTAVRDITLEEVELLRRNVAGIESVAPLVIGSASLAWGGRERDAVVLGTSAEFFPIRRLVIAQGESLPALDAATDAPVAVIGQTLKRELFGSRRAIGEWVRVRDYRFRVVGVLAGRGDSFGLDLSESVFVPVASAQSIFDVHGLFRVMFLLRPGVAPATASRAIEERMKDYHDGKEDVTVTSPEAMLRTFDGILRVLT